LFGDPVGDRSSERSEKREGFVGVLTDEAEEADLFEREGRRWEVRGRGRERGTLGTVKDVLGRKRVAGVRGSRGDGEGEEEEEKREGNHSQFDI